MHDVSTATSANIRRFAALGGAILFFCAALAVTSGAGPGLDPDSMAYIGASRSLAEHGELRVPLGKWELPDTSLTLTVWPPAFSVAMAGAQLFGATPLSSARIVIALAAALTIGGAVLLLYGAVPIGGLVLGVAALAVTPSFVSVHISVLSEPLFLALLTLTLLGMVEENIPLSGFGAAAAVMTRYAGVSAGGAVAIWFFWVTKGSLSKKLKAAIISAAPSVIAFLAWMAHNASVKAVQSGIRISYYPGVAGTLREGIETATGWLAPSLTGVVATITAAFALFLLVAAIAASFGREKSSGSDSRRRSRKIFAAAALLLGCYLAVLILSRALVAREIRFDERILAPAFLLTELMLIPVSADALRADRRVTRVFGAAVVALWIAASVVTDVPEVTDAIQDGNDFAASEWKTSPTIAWTKDEARGIAIYTNWPAAIYFNGGRAAYDLPTTMNPDTVRLFSRTVAARHGIFVAFNERNPDYPPSDSLAAAAQLIRLKQFSDGSVWIPSAASAPAAGRSGAPRR